LKLSEFHEKWEYYAGTIRNEIRVALGGDPLENEGLIKWAPQTIEDQEAQQEREDRLFMQSVLGLSKKVNKNG